MTFGTTKDLGTIINHMDQGKEQKKATDLIIIKTWNPGALKFSAMYGAKFGVLKYNALGFDVHDFGALNNNTFEYGAQTDAMKANGSYTMPRLQEPRSETRDDVYAETRSDVRADPSDWDPGGGPVKPQYFCILAWWGHRRLRLSTPCHSPAFISLNPSSDTRH